MQMAPRAGKSFIYRLLLAMVFQICALVPLLQAQSGFDDDRVMLQGFYWESPRFGHRDRFPDNGKKLWYEIVKSDAVAIADANFDLIWLPPPEYAGDFSVGYNPKQFFRVD